MTKYALSAIVTFITITAAQTVFAGTITSPYQYAWSNRVGYINFAQVGVGDSALTGYAWSANAGWIAMSPAQGGVSNNGAGDLSGSAWGESLGWIDFSNVAINPTTGKFSGTATGKLVGTWTFDCAYCDVRTDWRQARASTPVAGGGIFGMFIFAPTPKATTTEVNLPQAQNPLTTFLNTVVSKMTPVRTTATSTKISAPQTPETSLPLLVATSSGQGYGVPATPRETQVSQGESKKPFWRRITDSLVSIWRIILGWF